ncbi:thrombospondin [Micromonospora sp. SL4-19]|uniref:thrombospondin n=1 Tax=Micromonospora sp. SL4-19 TaxID=3399129 RepID=UPI003A4DC825
MKILSRRNGPARTQDVNGDGIVDGRDRDSVADRVDDRSVATDRDRERTTYRSGATDTDGEPLTDAERHAAERHAADRAATARAAAAGRPLGAETRDTRAPIDPDPDLERTADLDRDGRPDRPLDRADVDGRTAPTAPGPKPRASLLATLGLIVSVAGALFVLTGTLAGYGIGLGAAGAVLAVLGLIATRRRHVAGKTDALIGILVGLGAVVLGIMAMTGQFDWPNTDGEWVGRFRDWLDAQFAGRF